MSTSKEARKVKWQENLAQWQASGKSAATWCKEQEISHNTFCYWKNKLKESPNNSVLNKNDFVEIADKPQNSSGIIIECQGIIIHLSKNFDPKTLMSCLHILRGC